MASVVASVVASVLAAVVAAVVAAAVGVASLSAVAGTASSGLAFCLSTSAPCLSVVADAAAAGPRADADADDSSHLPPKPRVLGPPKGLGGTREAKTICW